jgi:hypothetical protein
MTKRHFKAIAEILKVLLKSAKLSKNKKDFSAVAYSTIIDFVKYLSNENPRFDVYRFKKAIFED